MDQYAERQNWYSFFHEIFTKFSVNDFYVKGIYLLIVVFLLDYAMHASLCDMLGKMIW